jgi:gluconate 2-dehydrogenase gamma chain
MSLSSDTTVTQWKNFTQAEAETIEAVCERIFPSDDGRPGAREARVIVFIDRTVTDEDEALRRCYRDGVQALNALSNDLHGEAFPQLSAELQDKLLERIDDWVEPSHKDLEHPQPLVQHPLAIFFALVWEHTIQGMFCDPKYGGNHNTLGWQLVGFPGAQWGYNAEQMKPGFDSTTIPIKSLEDLRKELRGTNA